MFERDKAELRELGVPLETGRTSIFDTEDGYRIARRDYELPEVVAGRRTRPPRSAWPPGCGSPPSWPTPPAARCSSCGPAGVDVEPARDPGRRAPAGRGRGGAAPLPGRGAGRPGGAVRLPQAGGEDVRAASVEPWGVRVLARPVVSGRPRPRPGRAALLPAVPGRSARSARSGRTGAVKVPDRHRPGRRTWSRPSRRSSTGRPGPGPRRARASGCARSRRRIAGERGSDWDALEIGYDDPEWIADRVARQGSAAVVDGAGGGPRRGGPPRLRAHAAGRDRARRTRRRGARRRMSGSGDRLPRLLALLPYLLAHPGVRVAEAADDFGVPEAQLRRDLQLLWMCGLPGHGPGDLIDLSFEGDTVSVGHDAGLARPLRLTTDEALALVVALRTLADEPGLTDRGAVERALAKVEAAAGGAVEAASAVAVAVEPTDRVLAQLRGGAGPGPRRAPALLRRRPGTRRTERDVDPVRLRWADGRWYLEAWCRSVERRCGSSGSTGSTTSRSWTSRRPRRPTRSRATCPRASTSPRPSTRWSRCGWTEPGRVGRRLLPVRDGAARWPDGRLEVTLRAADPAWLRRLVLGLGPAAEVVGPPWLVEQVRAEAATALAAYGDGRAKLAP